MAGTDLFTKVNLGTATTLSSPGYTVGATSINVSSTAELPSATGIVFSIDEVDADGLRVDGTYNVFSGQVTSATQISSLTYLGGDPNRNYSAGATTRVYQTISAFQNNKMVDGISVHANQDGTLKANSVDTQAVEDGAITTPKIDDGAVTNAKLATGAGEPGGAWDNWTPTYSNITVGNGTVTARYKQVGKTVYCQYLLLCGSTTSIATTATVSLPVTAASIFSASLNQAVGDLTSGDAGTKLWVGTVTMSSTTTASIYYNDGTGGVTSIPPYAETTGDYLSLSWSYEAA